MICSRHAIALGAAAFVVGLAACGPKEVQAKDYDQSCAQDSDCVLVAELTVSGGSCSIGCPNAAIRASERERYNADLKSAESSCDALAQPSCSAGTGGAACVSGRCAYK